MEVQPPRCAVTGATGYVGSRVCDYFSSRGWSVFEFGRRRSTNASNGRKHVSFELGAPVAPSLFTQNEIHALVHCAYDFRPTSWNAIRRINVEGSIALLSAAKNAGVKTNVFVSSISAFQGCRSLYGQAKLAIEQVALEQGAAVVRPGLVYGRDAPGGMFGSLQRIAANSLFIPLIGTGRYPQYLVHEDDLCELFLSIATRKISVPPVPIVAAARRPWCIRDLLKMLSVSRRAEPVFIPIPWRIVWGTLKAFEMCGLRLPFRSDSVISLVQQNANPDFSIAAGMSVRFRDFDEQFAAARDRCAAGRAI
jgi:nucleoside-diphosphate-sugar epimerase